MTDSPGLILEGQKTTSVPSEEGADNGRLMSTQE